MDKKDLLYKRFKNADARRTNWKNTYKEALEYFSPQRDTFDEPSKGSKRTNINRIFDSTGQDALDEAVSNAQAEIFPPQKNWGKLRLGPLLKNKSEDLQQKLEEITELFFTSLHNSNFDTQVSEFLEDWMIGTGNMLMHKGTVDKPFIFEAIPLDQVYLERGKFGSVGGRFRKWKLPAHLIKETWPDANISQTLDAQIKQNPYEEICVIEYTIEDDIAAKTVSTDSQGKSFSKMGKTKGFRYVVQIENSKEVIVERENKSQPWINVRYAVSAGEVYGRGPVLKALADNKTLNKTKELVLKNASLAISGMWTVVDDGVINLENIIMEPGAKIPVMANPGNPSGPSISPLRSSADFNVSQIIINDLVKSIKSILMAEPMGEIDAPVKTATEVAYRAQRAAKRMGSPFGRMQSEGAEQIMMRGLYILEELGMIDLSGFTIDGNNIGIQHVSPLAVAQDQEELTAMTRYAEIISDFFGPNGLMMMTNPLEFSAEISRLLGVKTNLLPSPEQMAAIRDLLAQQTGGMAPQGPQAQQQPTQ